MDTEDLRKIVKGLTKSQKDLLTEKAELSDNYLATFSCGQIKEPKRKRWDLIIKALKDMEIKFE